MFKSITSLGSGKSLTPDPKEVIDGVNHKSLTPEPKEVIDGVNHNLLPLTLKRLLTE
jgi:hypothetical protein